MASKCNNCRVKLGCSCKKRVASNGTSCCSYCIVNYEKSIKKNSVKTQTSHNAPVIIKATATQKE